MKLIDKAYNAAARRSYKINVVYDQLGEALDANAEDLHFARNESERLQAEKRDLDVLIAASRKEMKALAKERRQIRLAGRIYEAEELACEAFCNTVDLATKLKRVVRRRLSKGGRA